MSSFAKVKLNEDMQVATMKCIILVCTK